MQRSLQMRTFSARRTPVSSRGAIAMKRWSSSPSRIRQLDFHSALFAAHPAVLTLSSWRLDDPRQFCDLDSRSAARA